MNGKSKENWADFKSTKKSKQKSSGPIGLICMFLLFISIGAVGGAWYCLSDRYDITDEKAAKRVKWGAIVGGAVGFFSAVGAVRNYHNK